MPPTPPSILKSPGKHNKDAKLKELKFVKEIEEINLREAVNWEMKKTREFG